jgi:asparagine synthase (glutamine-hydrolysing)
MRTAPAPMFLLSKLVQNSGLKVVLTGEGADEFLAGYDIFKEAKIRRFWAREPESKWRPMLLNRLYGDIPDFIRTNNSFLSGFFREDLLQIDSPVYSHAIRWRNNRRACRFFSDETRHRIGQQATKLIDEQLDPDFRKWDGLARAQYLEAKIFLSQYLLSSQGDRVAMAHSIEGRYPFLDYRVVEFCNRLPSNLKLRGLSDKYLLRKLGQRWLPPEICRRPKRPYRAPIHRSFFPKPALDYVRELLSPERIKRTGLFTPAAVTHLVRKIEEAHPIGQTDDMALVGIISTQLLHDQFVSGFRMPPPVSDTDKVKVCGAHPRAMVEQSRAIDAGVERRRRICVVE